ncbi:hypothetical protein FB451DRAFT_1461458 [Mycena latifolia]|nr:hypothetical protein FB451DRAFT_1461458 [Mycena latifolia]
MAPGSLRSARADQRASTSGAGRHFTSPIKTRDKHKNQPILTTGASRKAEKEKALRARMNAILHPPVAPTPTSDSGDPLHPSAGLSESEGDMEMAWVDEPPAPPAPPMPPSPPPLGSACMHQLARERRHQSWDLLLPQLIAPFTAYRQASHGQRPTPIPNLLQHDCVVSCGRSITAQVQCLYLTHPESVHVITCSCMPVPVLLVRHGVFPTSPSQCRTGVSIDFLDVYRALFERSCDAITALAAALHTVYDRRGFRVISTRSHGGLVKEPFREGLAQAVQWYSNLRTTVQAKVDAVLAAAEQSILPPTLIPNPTPDIAAKQEALEVGAEVQEAGVEAQEVGAEAYDASSDTETIDGASHPDGPNSGDASDEHPIPPGPTPGRAHRILRERCPACFGLETWGRSLADGGDVQLGGNACFSYRHLRSAGDGPISYDPSSKKPREVNPPIPQEAIDACQASWDAANDKKQKVDPKRHDASGVFVLTCRHSQVLFLCDIDTLGERQEFIVALMEETNSYLPPQATIVQAYDVGCVTDHSFNLFPILSEGFHERVCFVINAMHSFGHQWVCQIVYSPRLHRGLCLTDAKGVERFWSRIRKLIGITRSQWNSRRIWMIDQYTAFVNEEGRSNLGSWIHRQEHRNLTRKRRAAKKVLAECGVSIEELRRNWAEQKAAQTSIRSHAPVRLRRELDKVLSLQAQIDAVEQSITDVKNTIKGPDASPDSIGLLCSLTRTNETLNTQAEALYASLNISQSFPELQNLPLEFVRTLVVMRDLKINIRKRAIGSFYEWETLDRAVGGRREALGQSEITSEAYATYLTETSQPALLRAIGKFNGYCAELERLRPPGCKIPIPSPLSTQLNGLRDDPTLHEDVWITPSEGQIPRWLNDSDVRDGIRALHSADRCAEEASRLNIERQNMTIWLKHEISIVAAAINMLTDSTLTLELQLRSEYLKHLQTSWASDICIRPEPSADRGQQASDAPNAAPLYLHPAPPIEFQPPTSTEAPATLSVMVELEPEEDIFEDSAMVLTSDAIIASEELDPGSMSDSDHDNVLSIQDMLANPEAEEESTGVEADNLNFEIEWERLPQLSVDTNFLECVQEHNSNGWVERGQVKRLVLGLDGRPRNEVEPEDISRIQCPTGRLTGFGINALSAAFLNMLGNPGSLHAETANKCAVFSTYDLPRIRYKLSDDALWGYVQHTKYWEKDLWLIPIHRVDEEHWVLAVVDLGNQQILFFDSLALRAGGWRQDIRDVMVLITRMVVLANRHKHPLYVLTEEDTWVAHPLFAVGEPRQSNGHDCGLWVLCMMGAILRGYAITGVSEAQTAYVRRVFSDHLFSMPRC